MRWKPRGETRAFLPRTVPILDEQRRTVGATIVLADVTGLRQLDETKNGLLSMVSHELKTPLTSMRMVLHLVTEGKSGRFPTSSGSCCRASRDDAERLHQIVENLLDMGRIESGKALMELQAAQSPGVARNAAAEAARESFNLQGVKLQVQRTDDLPAVNADPTRIGHVLGNLLSNALRHTPDGGHVRLCARAADDWVEFFVEDAWPGHSPPISAARFREILPRPRAKRRQRFGPGPSIAKDIVEAHGGKIRVESDRRARHGFRFHASSG